MNQIRNGGGIKENKIRTVKCLREGCGRGINEIDHVKCIEALLEGVVQNIFEVN